MALAPRPALTASLLSAARIIRTKQWCDMLPCLEGEGCDLLINRSGWTCTQPGGRIKTTTVRTRQRLSWRGGGGACRPHAGSEGVTRSSRVRQPGPLLQNLPALRPHGSVPGLLGPFTRPLSARRPERQTEPLTAGQPALKMGCDGRCSVPGPCAPGSRPEQRSDPTAGLQNPCPPTTVRGL